MMKRYLNKSKRQQHLENKLEADPFCTDEDLAEEFGVSVQTIRLDRIALGIPEMRKRLKFFAERAYAKVRSVSKQEMIGELVDLDLGKRGISICDISEDMVLEKTKIARGHYLFAQANSLAVALIDAEVVLTGSARVRYKRPVYLGERVVAKAKHKLTKGNTHLISVYSHVDQELVFKAQFIVAMQAH